MNLDEYIERFLPAIEQEMAACVDEANGKGFSQLSDMLRYHLGWVDVGAGIKAQGKRVRPLILLLTCLAEGGDWLSALPAAAAVELVHNFSLIHDDIQDNSPLRRGRETIWKKWGIPQAINTGDSMFALAHMALRRLEGLVDTDIVLEANRILPEACLRLTQGQFLDLAYEITETIGSDDYWPMIHGKTASLIATSTQLGALLAGSHPETVERYYKFGEYVGLAFQVYDDYLGIWGEPNLTGKSIESDLVDGKKSLPVLYALETTPEFKERWQQGPLQMDEVQNIADMLEQNGVKALTLNKAEELTKKALSCLEKNQSNSEAIGFLTEFAQNLIHRKT